MRIILLFSTLALAQSAQPTTSSSSSSPACFPLTGSTTCQPFAGMQVQPLKDVFTDVASFDAFMITVKDKNDSYIADFKTRYSCPGYEGQGQRFHLSAYCGLFVNAATSNGCNNKAEDVQICQSTMASAISSLTALYNSTACTPPASNAARTTFMQGYLNYQGRISNSSSTCLAGFSTEIAQCGFYTPAEATAYCATNSQDACCGPTQLGNYSLPLMIKSVNRKPNDSFY